MDTHYDPPQDPIRVLHDDHEILVVDKPAGLLSVPGKGEGLADCLIERLKEAFPMVLLVHRLDRDTSGVIVFALTRHAQRHLGLQFEKRTAKKTYLARVAGRLEPKTGTVDLPICADWPNRPLQKVDHAEGRAALTDWRVLRAGDDESRVQLMPHTGRSHQLRVHMVALGHPILGDPLYAPETSGAYPRMMLHAQELRLRHPDGGEGIRFRCPAPF
ncbi:RluA family pseudouridine synthase [Puniceibacterium sp. IMCC21224]|uniref:RluA family pseudouridine synthase n=1 Tax=Puniceibacterium sp. IMCC21224 TaxID=1618204 RepID=UPI00064DC0A1|nr:RluA family pseudouridine synthase [Puniceibacterium sp. IMCC21224]KMK68717.1 ribosomal large subunit pseudouridine synthase A [Puniceibacterium sp. IMCC21224]